MTHNTSGVKTTKVLFHLCPHPLRHPPHPLPGEKRGGLRHAPGKLPQVGVCSQVRDVVPVDTYLYVTLQLMRL